MPKFDTPKPISLTLELGLGDARIIASDRTDTIVEVRPRDVSRDADVKAAEQTRIEYANGNLLIKTLKPRNPFGRGSTVDVTVELPTGSHLQGELAMGDMRSEGELGTCLIKTGMGNVGLARTGELHAVSGYGDIAVNHAAGDVDVSTGSGAVRLGDIDGMAAIKNANGETTVGDVTGEVRIKASNGDIFVAGAHSSVTARTANGNIRVAQVRSGAIVIETAAGEIEIGIREGTAAWLDVSSHYGRVRNSLEPSDGPESSDETVEVRARTSYGDIVIRRATAQG